MSFLSGSGLGGLWLAIIGLFLIDSARAAALDIAVREDFRGLRVADIMLRDCVMISRGASVSEIGEAMKPIDRLHHVAAEAPATEALDAMAQEDVNQLPVLDDGQFLGVVSRDQMLRLIALRTELAM